MRNLKLMMLLLALIAASIFIKFDLNNLLDQELILLYIAAAILLLNILTQYRIIVVEPSTSKQCMLGLALKANTKVLGIQVHCLFWSIGIGIAK